MTRNLIQKVFRLFVGRKRHEDEDAIASEVIAGHVPGEEVDIYDSIMTAKVEPMSGEEINSTIESILSITEDFEEEDCEEEGRRERITTLCKEILVEQAHNEKMEKIGELLSVGSGMTPIALFTIRLKEKTGL